MRGGVLQGRGPLNAHRSINNEDKHVCQPRGRNTAACRARHPVTFPSRMDQRRMPVRCAFGYIPIVVKGEFLMYIYVFFGGVLFFLTRMGNGSAVGSRSLKPYLQHNKARVINRIIMYPLSA